MVSLSVALTKINYDGNYRCLFAEHRIEWNRSYISNELGILLVVITRFNTVHSACGIDQAGCWLGIALCPMMRKGAVARRRGLKEARSKTAARPTIDFSDIPGLGGKLHFSA